MAVISGKLKPSVQTGDRSSNTECSMILGVLMKKAILLCVSSASDVRRRRPIVCIFFLAPSG